MINLYATIFENNDRGLAILDNSTGCFVSANRQFCKMANTSKEKLLFQKDFDFVTKQQISEQDLEEYREVLRGNKPVLIRYYHLTVPEDQGIYLKIRVAHLVSGYSLIEVENISQECYLKQKREACETQYQYLFDLAPVGLWEEDLSDVLDYLETLNLQGWSFDRVYAHFEEHPDIVQKCLSLAKVVDVNYTVLDQFMVTDKAYFISNIAKHVVTEKAFATARYFFTAVYTRQDIAEYETNGITSTGACFDFLLRWNITPEMRKNNCRRVILASIDISHLKKTQKTLAETTARAETIINTVDGIIWTADPESLRINFISKKVELITGFSQEMFLGRKIFDFDFEFFGDQDLMNGFLKKIKQGIPGALEYPIKTKSGELKWLQINITFIKVKEKVVLILAIVVDITTLKQSKERLHQSITVLSEQNKRLIDFSYIVSHTLCSHSSNLLGLCDLINKANEEDEKKELQQLLSDVSRRLHSTMEGLKQVTSLQVSPSLSKETLSLRESVNKCYQMAIAVSKKEVCFENNISASAMLKINRDYLENILLTIISNAIKFSHPDRKPKVQLEFNSDGDQRVLKIKDNGLGIDLKNNCGRLFGLFKNFSTDPGSRGIGLYIAKNQVEAMGGSIEVESEPGKGSCFKVYFQ